MITLSAPTEILLTCASIDDDDALRIKVQEALNVYDEYMKAQSNGAKEDEKKEGEATTA